MKEKRIMIRLSTENAQWLERWRQNWDVPVSLTHLANRALSEQAEFYAKMKFNLVKRR